MAKPIKDFIGSFNKTELARPCHFDVSFRPSTTLLNAFIGPSVAGKLLQSYLIENGSSFRFRCEAAELPSRTFSIVEQQTYGPVERHPALTSYDPITLTFMVSDDMSEKYFFDLWMEAISVSSPLGAVTGAIGAGLQTFGINLGLGVRFDLEYRDNYTSTIEINQYDLNGKNSYKTYLIEAFPYTVNQLPLNWRDTDSYHRLSVGFYYKYFTLPNLL